MNLMQLPEKVQIVEVGLRDGLQNESCWVPTEDKIRLADALIAAGITRLEATSFVHPKWVPQLRDAEEVSRSLKSRVQVKKSALVPNEKGYERAKNTGIDEINLFVSVSKSHNIKNVNRLPEESVADFEKIIEQARGEGIRVRVALATAFGCPFEGQIDVSAVRQLAVKVQQLGADEIVLADTIGIGHPRLVAEVLNAVSHEIPAAKLAVHFHDTWGRGLANVLAALAAGITTFDAAVGGLGGCPFAPGAAGNIATEDLVDMLTLMGIETGINQEGLLAAVALVKELTGKTSLPEHAYQAKMGREKCNIL